MGMGDPIDYATVVASVAGSEWTSAALSFPGRFKLGVRAFDPLTGLEEQNLDAAVELVLDATGNDVTGVPHSPVGLRAFPVAGGKVRVEWTCPCSDLSRQPRGFHIYVGSGLIVDYSQPVATLPWSSGRFGSFSADLSGLTDRTNYAIGVRAFSAVGEESNTFTAIVMGGNTPLALVDSFEAVVTNQGS
jgi:hypothetical protein